MEVATERTNSGARDLRVRWVVANSLAEIVGLGSTLGIGVLLFPYLRTPGVLGTVLVAVLAGTLVEGTVVGTAQWLVLRCPLPELRWRAWALATAAGAFVAWTVGMLPGTLLGSGGRGSAATTEPEGAVLYGLAGLMGLAAGTILGTPQALVLHRLVPRALLWVPRNALAWVPGIVLAFVAIGAVVGAIHGLTFVWLLRSREVLNA